MSEYLLQTRGLTKQYGRHKAVENVDIHVKKGAIYGFIGRNGAGKSTCLKMVSGLSRPTAGEIEFFGYSGKELKDLRSRIGCLIEMPGLYGNMTAYQNLKIKCEMLGINKKGYVEDILKTVGMEKTGRKKTKHFSLGMKQRLGIGLALVGEPDLLVLDEPINGLDPQGIVEVRDTIQKLRDERNMTKYIIGTISAKDAPKTPQMKGAVSRTAYYTGTTQEMVQREREQILDATVEDIQALAPIVEAILSQNQICVVGSEEAIEREKDVFQEVKHLIS